ncbi:MAG: 4Fe-4S binding protein [Candidatus Hodarchaeales archaeon]
MSYIPMRRAKKTLALRLLIQFVILLLLNAVLWDIDATWLVLPVNMPYSPYASGVGAIYLLQRMLTATIIPFLAIAVFVIIGSIFGRAFCAWGCPFGLVQDILSLTPNNKYRPNRKTNTGLKETGQFFLVLGLGIAAYIGLTGIIGDISEVKSAFGAFGEEPLAPLDPGATLFGGLPYWAYWETFPGDFNALIDFIPKMDILLWARLLILFFTIFLALFIPRGWCRWFCPTGLLMGMMAPNSILGVGRNITRCTHCGDCERSCPMHVRILDYSGDRVRDSQCINCLECMEICPEDAIELRFM